MAESFASSSTVLWNFAKELDFRTAGWVSSFLIESEMAKAERELYKVLGRIRKD